MRLCILFLYSFSRLMTKPSGCVDVGGIDAQYGV